jgi:2-C-methyl-D-erythritol 4-phosphate cytidylyltransferase
MNVALIIAGGIGERTRQEVPKQFLHIYDKPIVVYTLEAFQSHEDIDAIVVVCLDGWQEIVKAYARQFGMSKLESITSGGDTGQASILAGLRDIQQRHSADDTLVMIHEAVRPMVSQDVISDSLRVCSEYGGAVAAIPCVDAMLETFEVDVSRAQIPRDRLVRAQNPHTFPLGKLLWAHEEAGKRGINNSVSTGTLMIELGETLHLSVGSEKNFKLTTAEDIEIFKALLDSDKPGWMRKERTI